MEGKHGEDYIRFAFDGVYIWNVDVQGYHSETSSYFGQREIPLVEANRSSYAVLHFNVVLIRRAQSFGHHFGAIEGQSAITSCSNSSLQDTT